MVTRVNFVMHNFDTQKKMENMKLLIICTFTAPLILQVGRGESIHTASQTGDECQTGRQGERRPMLTKP